MIFSAYERMGIPPPHQESFTYKKKTSKASNQFQKNSLNFIFLERKYIQSVQVLLSISNFEKYTLVSQSSGVQVETERLQYQRFFILILFLLVTLLLPGCKLLGEETESFYFPFSSFSFLFTF